LPLTANSLNSLTNPIARSSGARGQNFQPTDTR
jgi:hypothetical protein